MKRKQLFPHSNASRSLLLVWPCAVVWFLTPLPPAAAQTDEARFAVPDRALRAAGDELVKPRKIRVPTESIVTPHRPSGPEHGEFEVEDRTTTSIARQVVADGSRAPAAPVLFGAPAPMLNVLRNWPSLERNGAVPPDPNLAVGPEHIVVTCNNGFAFHNKNGVELARFTFEAFLGNDSAFFDPKCSFDPWDNRFVMLVLRKRSATEQAWFTLWISDDTNPFGDWYVYNLNASKDGGTDNHHWADYPALGWDPSALYLTANMVSWNEPCNDEEGRVYYAKLRILDKTQLYNGQPAGWYDFWGFESGTGENEHFVFPCNCMADDATFQDAWLTPVQMRTWGGITYLLNAKACGGDFITVRRITNPLDWANGPELTREIVPVGAYSPPPKAAQPPGGANPPTLDTLGNMLMDKTTYYLGQLYTAHPVAYVWPTLPATDNRAALKLYRFDLLQSPINVERELIYGAPGFDYFFPSMQQNDNRDMFIVFARVSDVFDELASVRATAWPDGGAIQSSKLIKAGEAFSGDQRWGDYFGAQLDPTDPQTVWVIGEYPTVPPPSPGGGFGGGLNPAPPPNPGVIPTAKYWKLWVAELNLKANTAVAVENLFGAIGETVALRATLTRTDTGDALPGQTLHFEVNNQSAGSAVTDNAGVAVRNFYVAPSLGLGVKPIVVTFHSTPEFNGSVGSNVLRVVKAPTDIQVADTGGPIGETVELRGTLRRSTDDALLAFRFLNFSIDGTVVGSALTDAQGVAKRQYMIAENLTPGNHTIRIDFAGDALHLPSSGEGLLRVIKGDLLLTVRDTTQRKGKTATLVARARNAISLLPSVGRIIVFKVDDNPVGSAATINDGTATLSYPIPNSTPPGEHTLTAEFQGDDFYHPSAATGTLTVTAQ